MSVSSNSIDGSFIPQDDVSPGVTTRAENEHPEDTNPLDAKCSSCEAGHRYKAGPGHTSIAHLSTFNLCPCCHAALAQFSNLAAHTTVQIDPGVLQHDNKTWEQFSVEYAHHYSEASLREAVEVYGCRLCWLLIEGIRDETGDYDNKVSWGNLKFMASAFWGTEFRIFLDVRGMEGKEECSILMLKPLRGDTLDLKCDARIAKLHTESDYTDSLAQAKSWIQECSQSHDKCRLPPSEQSYQNPTRLICVKDGDMRICRRDSIPSATSYATLSHCWGHLKIQTLTSANSQELHHEIKFHELCKTFQDAIRLTRLAGFEYLWIDSLCIIQDDLDDWRQESALMAHVYGCSSLNISATGAANGSEGCFFERLPSYQLKYELPLLLNGALISLSICSFPPESWRYNNNADSMAWYQRLITSQPLLQRAWCIQERLLSRRTLHFSRPELFWECKTKSASENFPDEFPRALRFDEFYEKEKGDALSWEDVVHMYTRTSLTKSTDKLVAIGGIAASVQKTRKDSYLAGLWRRELEKGLYWNVWVGEAVKRPTTYRAPSWSWAAVDGPVCPAGTGYNTAFKASTEGAATQTYIEVLDASVEAVGESPFGEIRGGKVTLRCEGLIPAAVSPVSKDDGFADDMRLHLRTGREHVFHGQPLWDCPEDVLQAGLERMIYVLPVWREVYVCNDNPMADTCSLVLQRVEGGGRGCYRRSGTFTNSRAWSHADPDWIVGVVERGDGEVEEEEYVEVWVDGSGKRRFVIEII